MKKLNILLLATISLFIIGCGGASEESGETNSGQQTPPPSEFVNAIDFNISTSQTGDINFEVDNLIDYYKIDINTTGTYTLYLASLAAGTNTSYVYTLNAEIFNEQEISQSKVKVYYQAFNSTGTENIIAEFEATTIGTHYIKISRARFDAADPIATAYKFRVEPSITNGLLQNSDLEYNDTFSQATPLRLETFKVDVNGTLNSTDISDYIDWYEFKELEVGTYTIFFKANTGTLFADGSNILAEVFNDNRIQETNYRMDLAFEGLDQEGQWDRRVFKVTTAGSYFLKLNRTGNYAANYSFKVIPSISNGFILDANDEPNDERHLAKEIVLSDANTTIVNTLATTDVSDSDDWYKFISDVTGSVDIQVETLSGTADGTYGLLVDVVNQYGVVIKTIPGNQYYLNTTDLVVSDSVALTINEVYYLHMHRRYNPAVHYKITIAK